MRSDLPRAVVTGLGIYLPPKVLTNQDLEKFLDTSDEWIRERTGIRQRHVIEEGMATSDMAVEAGRKALEDAGLGPQDVDLVIVATFTPDHPFPSTASIVQAKLGCTRAGAFDMETACTGWIAGMATATMWIQGGGAKTVLMIGSDAATRSLDWKDRSTAVIFGDAASAAVLRPEGKGFRILSTYLGSDGNGLTHLWAPAGGSRRPTTPETAAAGEHLIHMEGKATYKFAVKAMADSVLEACRRADVPLSDVKLLIPHQANARIIEAAAKRLELDPSRVLINIDRYGNTVAASIGIGLYEARQEGRLSPGDVVAFAGMGAGLSWGGIVARWIG